jgi:hypothetical protein
VTRARGISICLLAACMAPAIVLGAADSARVGQEPTAGTPRGGIDGKLVATVGKSLIIDSPLKIEKISVANGDLVEAVAINPQEVLINGKLPGETSLIVWQQGGQRLVYDLTVRLSPVKLEAVRQQIARDFPNDDINVTFDNDTVFVRGSVRDMLSANRVLQIAATLGKAVNLLRVAVAPAGPEVLLKVTFATIDISVERDLGFSLLTNAFNQQTSISPSLAGTSPNVTSTAGRCIRLLLVIVTPELVRPIKAGQPVIGLAIENRDLWEQAQACLSDLPFRIIVEHQDIGDVSNFLDRLERMRPDVVLIDISGWREPSEGLVTSIRGAIGDPMIIALNSTRSGLDSGVDARRNQRISVSAAAGAAAAALERRSAERSRQARLPAPRRRQELRFLFRQGRLRRHHGDHHVAAGTGPAEPESAFGRPRPGFRHGRLHHQDQVGVLDSGRRQQSAPPRYSLLEGAGLQRHSGRRDRGRAAGPGLQEQIKDEQVRHVLGFARPHYDWTLVDLGRSLSHTAMAALEEIDEACLVTTLEVPALHQSKQIIQTLLDSGYGKNKIR